MGTEHKETILEVKNLKTHFFSGKKVIKAVDGVDFDVKRGETLGIVGESGSGKSITSLSIMRLIAEPPGKIVDGEINFKGKNLLSETEEGMRQMRGNKISMIFQEPMTSLNPVYSVGEQIAEAFRIHQKLPKKEAWQKAVEMLRLVGIPSPEKRAKQEPHELSGGQRQRIGIARALAVEPKLIICDEAVSALDVSVQAQVLNLLKKLQKEYGLTYLFISHDLGVVRHISDRIIVMYLGKVVEIAEKKSLFDNPRHPYTQALLSAIPEPNRKKKKERIILKGDVPSPIDPPSGCRFHTRCPLATDLCRQSDPELKSLGEGHQAACHYAEAIS
ncbi:ABC transporter ATP-binding protein [Cytobacillus firmus]|uniref:ABC transporter ATP-binding protein n=1 Tax=Cytobacillus firmus TaxID=1399 RepID=UPI0018CF42EB|nr:peptide ABC transporter ATP-binding protein [Cytobacillus firmus]MBG9603167.1 peptide ABC transporter ATP-binding protein [Cytobacillus firmus]